MEYIILRIFTICVMVLLPLYPALIIFRKFPDKTHVSGPFKGLTLNLTGAFAGYFILFISCIAFTPFIFKAITQAEKLENDKWTVNAFVQFKKSDSTNVDRQEIAQLLQSLKTQISIPLTNNTPNIQLSIECPEFLFAASRQLLFTSSKFNTLIHPNGLTLNDLHKRMSDNQINLDTIIVMLPPEQKAPINLAPSNPNNIAPVPGQLISTTNNN
jgi:hypothetical protein